MPAQPSEQLAPEFRLRVDGTDLPATAAADVLEVAVLLDVSAPSMFAVRLINWDMEKLQVSWADDKLFAVGAEVEILMGYAGRLATVMVGEITGLEPEFRASEVPVVTVRGYDRRHRLMRGQKTRSFTQAKDSDIAARIAQEAGLTAEVEDTQTTLEYVLQHNQTDLEFLTGRARRLGYEVSVDKKTLYFRPHANDKAEVLTLSRQSDLLELCPRLSTVGLAGGVEVRGWSAKDKEGLLGQSAAGDEGTTMGGKNGGLAVADEAFGAAVAVSVDRPVLGAGEAGEMAAGRLKEMALFYVTGEGVAVGNTGIQAGTVVKIEGCGVRFSGLYYLPSVTHTWTSRKGYRTGFTLRRNAT